MIRTRPRWLTAARLPANARASFSSAIDPLSHAPLHVGDVVQACSSSDGRFCLKRPSHGKPCWARSWRCADHPHACPAINIDRYHPGMGFSSAHKSSAHHSTVHTQVSQGARESMATSDDNGLGRRCCSRARPTGPGPSHHELPATYGRHSAAVITLCRITRGPVAQGCVRAVFA